MDETTARARLKMDVQADLAPVLTLAEVDDLLLRTRGTDAAGLVSGETGYVPTWDAGGVNRAIAAGYRIKASKIATEFDVALGAGTSFERSQKWEHFMAMATYYARRSGGAGGILSVALGAGEYDAV